ncbi:hypothetical protein AYO21_07510 [Fonsecaea monophora]|uniref:Uncharacterized protein n=1 Tax=Fonsecaea monophora TaxID=254056 RepID=A0A177F1T1_9EURO|nr:hypothetical protein AYO21_07510 [Fonsecaea monophora]OAG38284.1 hypothetical protein AYO21_07510 [Fonsecaea monophora]
MSAVPALALVPSAKKRPRTEDDIPTFPPPAKKRPFAEENVTTLALLVKKVKIEDSMEDKIPTLPLPAQKRPYTGDNINTLPSLTKKRPRTEENVTTLALSVQKLEIIDSIAGPNPSYTTDDEAGALTNANPTDVNACDEMADANMSDDEGSDLDSLPCDRSSWGSNSQMSFSSDSSDDEGEDTIPIQPFDREYVPPEDGYVGVSTSDVSGWHEQLLDDKETSRLFYLEGCVRLQRWKLLKLLDATASVPGPVKTDSPSLADANGKPSVSQKGDFGDSYAGRADYFPYPLGPGAGEKPAVVQFGIFGGSHGGHANHVPDWMRPEVKGKPSIFHQKKTSGDSHSDRANCFPDWSRPDAAGLEAAANGSRLQPAAIKLIVDFFHRRPHLNRTECEDYCLKKYLGEGVEFAAWKWPLKVHAYPSEFQFPDSYMVEIIDPSVSIPTHMTLFYITPKTLDEDQLAQAREAYDHFVPQYTYVGHMDVAGKHRTKLFVWRIEAPVGRPIAADIDRLGLRVNQEKYLNIMKHFVDFVCKPLPPRWDRRGRNLDTGKNWPMVPHNPLLDVNNIIVRPDWSGIAGVLLWGAPPLMTLPFGASLSGLLRLEGVPDLEDAGDDEQACEINPSMFDTYSRNGRELERCCLYYLREKIPTLGDDPLAWRRLFKAMRDGTAAAGNTSKIERICHAAQVQDLRWEWFRLEIEADIPDDESDVASWESGSGEEESGDNVDMDMD